MIVLYHSNNKVLGVQLNGDQDITFNPKDSISSCMHAIAAEFDKEIIVWCHILHKDNLNLELIPTILHHHKLLMSFSTQSSNYFGRLIGFVEESPCINVNKNVQFATWQMSGEVGIVQASVLNKLSTCIPYDIDFDYYLNSLAKLVMPLGLFCYSEPRLLKVKNEINSSKASIFTLFKFVKQHYKTRWVFLLFFNLLIYEKRLAILPALYSFVFKKRSIASAKLDDIFIQSTRKVIDKGTLDVIIPTIGRKQYLYDVLRDLANQTRIPQNVIIVEQNPVEGSVSELDYLTSEVWPFVIKKKFIHQSGACNARNVALEQIESEWVFFADDDIRIEGDFVQKVFDQIQLFGVEATSIRCVADRNSSSEKRPVVQWSGFGAGSSFVSAKGLNNCQFKMGYEFGYGEDGDFGMQLRNNGYDILFLSTPEIVHLKAPIGGFRTKPVLKWHHEEVQPKPSPTVLLYILNHNTKEQLLGYKTNLFFKYYFVQAVKNPFKYFSQFQKQWNKSVFWANQLKKEI